MFNIIALVSLIVTTLTPQAVKPAYLHEYDFIGEMPEITVTATYPSDEELKLNGMMPEVQVTALRNTAGNNITGDVPEVLITAPRANSNASGMMPEVLITAKRDDAHKLQLVHHKDKSEKEG
jgi:hypothetical protein